MGFSTVPGDEPKHDAQTVKAAPVLSYGASPIAGFTLGFYLCSLGAGQFLIWGSPNNVAPGQAGASMVLVARSSWGLASSPLPGFVEPGKMRREKKSCKESWVYYQAAMASV